MVRKLQSDKQRDIGLAEFELDGSPEVVASHYLEVSRNTDERLIEPPRASSIYDSCIRFHSIGYKCKFPEYNSTSASMRIIFSLGNGIHSWIQNTPDVLGGNRIGWWECLGCGFYFWSLADDHSGCPKCGANKTAISYKEHELKMDGEYISSGHPDMFMAVGDKTRVLELKTIKGEEFDKLITPLISHKWQIQYYMWACSEDQSIPTQIDPEVGYILYISKMPGWKSLPFKMFPVIKDLRILKLIKSKLLLFSSSLKSNGYTPMHEDCSDRDSQRAKWCPVKNYCFEFNEAGL